MQTIPICQDNWNDKKGSYFYFENNTSERATVSKIKGETWPFADNEPIHVDPNTKKQCQLKSDLHDKTYSYHVDICPTLGGSKNVTIP